MDFVTSAFKVSLRVADQFDLDIVQYAVLSAMVPAMVFFAVPVVFVCVSVCVVDLCPWYELVVRVCVEWVGADEGREWKLHDEVRSSTYVKAAAGLGYSV